MKKSLLILAGIALFCFLLIVRLFYKQNNYQRDEREWFAKALRYEFSARVDSVRMLNNHTGRLWCRVTEGNPQTHREDSLKKYFRDHDMLYLIFESSADSIVFLVPNGGDRITSGDSVRVSSQNDLIRFFRNGAPVASDKLSNILIAHGRPFFLRKD